MHVPDPSDMASRVVLGAALPAAFAVMLAARRGATAWLLPLCVAPLLVSVLAGARDLAGFDADALWRVDASAWPTFVSRGIGSIAARSALGHGVAAALFMVVALAMGLGVRRKEQVPARWLTASSAAFAAASGAIGWAAHVRHSAYERFVDADGSERLAGLVAAADAQEPWLLARAGLTLLALALAAVSARLTGSGGAASGRVVWAVACMMSVQLGELALAQVATQQALAVLATPWSPGENHEVAAWPELSQYYPTYGEARAHLVLGREGFTDAASGRSIENSGAGLADALRALRERLRAERERADRAYAEEVALEEEVLDPDPQRADVSQLLTYEPPPRWEGCEPPDGDEHLAVAVDHRTRAEDLRQLVGAASEAGFAVLELVGPVRRRDERMALAGRDPVGAALLSHPAYGLDFALPGRCAAGEQVFLRGVVGAEAPSELEHSSGERFPLVERGLLARYRELTAHEPEVVLALGADVTPSALGRVHPLLSAAAERRLRPRLIVSPEDLPQARQVPPLTPLPPESGVDAGHVTFRAPEPPPPAR